MDLEKSAHLPEHSHYYIITEDQTLNLPQTVQLLGKVGAVLVNLLH